MNTFSSKNKQQETWLDADNLLQSIGQVLRARKWLILGTTLLTFALTAGGTWLTKPVYTASASILVKKERFDAPVTPEQVISTGQPDRRLSEEEINSEVEILNSPSLLEEVIKRLQLEQAFMPSKSNTVFAAFGREKTDDKASAMSRALTKLQENLTVEPGKKSNLIKISYKANDRNQVAQVINTLCQVYQERLIELNQSVDTKDFFAAQAETMRTQLNEKEAALKRNSPLPNSQLLNQQIETQMRQRSEYEIALQTTRTAIVETQARIQSLQQQMVKEPERLQSEERISRRSAPDAIKAQLFSLELRRSELLSKYKPNHRLIVDLDKDIEKARRMVEQIEKVPAESSVTSALNPLRQRLNDTLTNERSTLASLQEKERALSATVHQAAGKVSVLGAQGYEQRRLERERDLADQAYQLYTKKGEEGRISTALDKQGIVNISVIEAARAPYKATSPNVVLNLIVGLIGGIILSLAATFTLEYFYPTVQPSKPLTSVSKYVKAISPVSR